MQYSQRDDNCLYEIKNVPQRKVNILILHAAKKE